MTDYSMNEAVMQLTALAREVGELSTAADAADKLYREAKHAYELAWAKAILSVEASNADTRKAKATLDTAAEALALTHAEHGVGVLKRAVDQRKVRIDVGRTVVAGLRAEMTGTI